MGAIVLCYHSINYGQRIDPDTFEQNLFTLKKYGYVSVRLSDIYEFVKGNLKLPKKAVAITFDDGYADNLVYAYPILKKYEFFATIFVIVNKLAKNIKRMDIEELKKLNMANSVNEFLEKSRYLSFEELRFLQDSKLIDIQSHSLNHKACFCSNKVFKFNDSRLGEWFFEYTHDKRLGIPVYEKKWDCACECIIDDLKLRDYMHDFVAKHNGILFFKKKNAQKILYRQYKKYLKKNTLNMQIEPRYERIKRLEIEVFESKRILEEQLNKSVDFFCYPFGSYDEVSKEYVKRAYKAAFTLKIGQNMPDDDLFELKRIEVRGGDWLDKRLKIYKSPFLSRVYAKIYRKI
ncbi:MAG: polysaccharide deacetylase family protein [Desulfurella sp.]|uniref:polysaccharide deacetylase family protein n=1 Tax=Desulfurella sp. TaxID=1962857 RepID=UPI003D0C7F76